VAGGLVVAGVGGLFSVATSFNGLNTKFDNLQVDFEKVDKKLDAALAALAPLAGVPRALRSMGLGVQQLANNQPVTAFATATPAQLGALLQTAGFGQYAVVLGHLSGAEAMLQTEESLRALGVAQGHAKPLLEVLTKKE
jgi:hypothetical protein